MNRLYFASIICMMCMLPIHAQDKDTKTNNYVTAMRAFYLWRCGMPVHTDHEGNHYFNEACHTEDGCTDYILPELSTGNTVARFVDGTGGWHDAGDFGKYTVNAGVTLGTLFYAWNHFSDKLRSIPLDLPETAPGYPEFLKELKWETDFILKMQYPDGSGRVSHKLTRKAFSGFIMPSKDKETRYYTTWSSAATADFVAMMSMASRHFKPYDKVYSKKCLKAAKVSWQFLVEHPENKGFVQGDFSTGSYMTGDDDDRLWAAAELWETTGDKDILAYLEQRIGNMVEAVRRGSNGNNAPKTGSGMPDVTLPFFGMRRARPLIDSGWDWGNVTNLGMWTYVLSNRKGRNPELVAEVKQAVAANAKSIADQVASDEYGCPITSFYWGCNGTAARLSVNLHVAEMFNPEVSYKTTIERIARWILGNNYYHRSFVTGLGINPPMHPHDRRSAADGIEAPWPGYLVGGGHTATDWVDDQEDYSRNEIAINWQAGLVYLLAAVL